MQDPRLARLLNAVLAVAGDLDLETVLQQVVNAGCELVDAAYGALGVIAEDGEGLEAFVHQGMSPEQVARIGSLPAGHGILGLLIDEPEPLRLDDLSRHQASYGFPEGHPPMRSFIGVPIRVGEQVFGNLYLTEKRSGEPFTADDEELVIGLAAVAGTAIQNARLFDELSRRETWRAAVQDVATAVLNGEDPSVVRQRVVDQARALVEADAACLIAPRGQDGAVLAARGPGPVAGMAASLDADPLARALAAPGECLEADDGRVPVLEGASAWTGLEHEPGRAAVLGVGRAERFTPSERALLAQFGAQASLALAHGTAQADLRRLSLIEERERIGRDLHDTVIQRLFATGLSLQAVTRRVDADVAPRLDRAVDEIDEIVREIRSTIFALQQREEQGAGVRAQLLEIVDELTPVLPGPPRLRLQGPVDLLVDDRVAQQLLPVVREGLTNVAKHAGAEVVELDLRVEPGHLTLTIADDGRGLPDPLPEGFGLGNLRRRAESLDGQAEIVAGRQGGTALHWQVPLG